MSKKEVVKKDVWVSMAINVVLALVKEAVKSPAKAQAYKSVLLKLRDAITIVYEEA